MKKQLIILVFSLVCSSATFAQSTFSEQTFNSMMERWRKDYATFQKNEITPDFLFLGSNGTVSDYKQFMAFTEGASSLVWEFSNVKVRQYGNAAVVTSRWKHSHRQKDTRTTPVYEELTTAVFALQGNRWAMVSLQATTAK